MDPELVKGLQQIKKFLDDGTFSQQDFDKQKSALLDVYPVARPGPTLGGVPHSPASQPQASQPQASQPLKGVSDADSRDHTGKHRFGFRKCCQCPLQECYWTAQAFSPSMFAEKNASIRLCLRHDGSQGPMGTPVAFTTPKRKVRRQLISQAGSPQAAIDIPTASAIDIPTASISQAGSPQAAIDIPTASSAIIDMGGGRTGFVGSGTAATTAGTTGTAGSRSRTVPTAGTGARTVPLYGNSFDPLPAIPETMSLVSIDSGTAGDTSKDSDVQILDVCSVPNCRAVSTSMLLCGQCKKFCFCGRRCAQKCPCLQKLDKNVAVQSAHASVLLNNLNRVSKSSSATQTCKYCGSRAESVDGACSVCYDQYCLRSCTWTFVEFCNLAHDIFVYEVVYVLL